jgi:hypothetical protein
VRASAVNSCGLTAAYAVLLHRQGRPDKHVYDRK